ncbi:aldo/keto reductase [Bailinhaonella thermotolerans]|uniref:Aldo/keto reductase n=1 Tax=Bailinhaonella thermotolerans TaxID=1070861 RepID=A0A3A4ASR8_9ACTN|nr:aldo/keto reductase [Bailinhaonella thermotolerans]RJL33080.1 aldo/keto reductase [Bailinhaonella thermotolerans]
MRQITIGNSEKSVTGGVLALGALPFGTRVDEETSFAILDRFAEAGGTVIDTSNNYAFWLDGATGDESETVVGRWLASRGARDRMVISTKVGARPTIPGDRTLDHIEGLSAAAIRKGAEGSLRRLGTDRIDVYWAHVEDRSVPLEETVGAFTELVDAGTVKAVGLSNHRTWRAERARALAPAHARPSCLQLRHSYLRPRPGARLIEGGHQQVTEEVLDYVAAEGLTLFVYNSLLAGAYTNPDRPLAGYYDHPGTTARLARLREVAAELGATPNQVVLAWLMTGEIPIVPIVGVSTVAQLDEVLAATALTLDPALRAHLDEPV